MQPLPVALLLLCKLRPAWWRRALGMWDFASFCCALRVSFRNACTECGAGPTLSLRPSVHRQQGRCCRRSAAQRSTGRQPSARAAGSRQRRHSTSPHLWAALGPPPQSAARCATCATARCPQPPALHGASGQCFAVQIHVLLGQPGQDTWHHARSRSQSQAAMAQGRWTHPAPPRRQWSLLRSRQCCCWSRPSQAGLLQRDGIWLAWSEPPSTPFLDAHSN